MHCGEHERPNLDTNRSSSKGMVLVSLLRGRNKNYRLGRRRFHIHLHQLRSDMDSAPLSSFLLGLGCMFRRRKQTGRQRPHYNNAHLHLDQLRR
jgi:hypothetical protein